MTCDLFSRVMTGRPYLKTWVEIFSSLQDWNQTLSLCSSPMSSVFDSLKAENTITDNVYMVYSWEVYTVLTVIYTSVLKCDVIEV